MPENKLVAVWLGCHKDHADLQQYVSFDYARGHKAPSSFCRDAGLGNFNEDSFEAFMFDPAQALEQLKTSLYADHFFERLQPYLTCDRLHGKNAAFFLFADDHMNRDLYSFLPHATPNGALDFIGLFHFVAGG